MSRGSVERRPSANATFRCPAAPGALTPVSEVRRQTHGRICVHAGFCCRLPRNATASCHKGVAGRMLDLGIPVMAG
jgi:hypothetical protein